MSRLNVTIGNGSPSRAGAIPARSFTLEVINMTLRFPLLGINKGFATVAQPGQTTFDCLNVRAFDALDGRARGGQRPGYDKWGTGTQIGSSEEPVVAMCVVGSLR
jgi:hypothetical protein